MSQEEIICCDCGKQLDYIDSDNEDIYCESCFQKAQDDMEGRYSFDE